MKKVVHSIAKYLAVGLSVAAITVLFIGFVVLGLINLKPTSRPSPPPKNIVPTAPATPPSTDVAKTPPQRKMEVVINPTVRWPLRPAALRVANQTVIVFQDAPHQSRTLYGTGFIVAPHIIVTAAHIVFGDTDVPLKPNIRIFCDNREVPGRLLRADRLSDVAIIRADCQGQRLRLSTRPTRPRERLYVAGFDFATISAGYITRGVIMTEKMPRGQCELRRTAAYGTGSDKFFVQLQKMLEQKMPPPVALAGAIPQGWSGSPIIRPNGEIIGLLMWRDPVTNRSFASPADNIRKLLMKQ